MADPDAPGVDGPPSAALGLSKTTPAPVASWDAPRPSRRPRSRRLSLGVGIGVAAVIVVVLVAVAANLWIHPTSRCNPVIPAPWNSGSSAVLATCGTRFDIPTDSFQAYNAGRFSDAEVLLGQYSANGSIGSYLLNGSEYTALLANPHPTSPPTGWFWSCGVGTGCKVQADVPPSASEYFLVLENFNGGVVSVVWSESLVVAWVPTTTG